MAGDLYALQCVDAMVSAVCLLGFIQSNFILDSSKNLMDLSVSLSDPSYK